MVSWVLVTALVLYGLGGMWFVGVAGGMTPLGNRGPEAQWSAFLLWVFLFWPIVAGMFLWLIFKTIFQK